MKKEVLFIFISVFFFAVNNLCGQDYYIYVGGKK